MIGDIAMDALPAASRTCGDCALCCHLGEIPDVKPFNVWCQHCSTQKGCDRYDARPDLCRSFFCHYLSGDIGEHWAPLVSHMVVAVARGPERILVSVDPETPLIWREAPYFAEMKEWSRTAGVIVQVGLFAWAVTPERIDALGEIGDAHTIVTLERETARGVTRLSQRVLKTEAAALMRCPAESVA